MPRDKSPRFGSTRTLWQPFPMNLLLTTPTLRVGHHQATRRFGDSSQLNSLRRPHPSCGSDKSRIRSDKSSDCCTTIRETGLRPSVPGPPTGGPGVHPFRGTSRTDADDHRAVVDDGRGRLTLNVRAPAVSRRDENAHAVKKGSRSYQTAIAMPFCINALIRRSDFRYSPSVPPSL